MNPLTLFSTKNLFINHFFVKCINLVGLKYGMFRKWQIGNPVKFMKCAKYPDILLVKKKRSPNTDRAPSPYWQHDSHLSAYVSGPTSTFVF